MLLLLPLVVAARASTPSNETLRANFPASEELRSCMVCNMPSLIPSFLLLFPFVLLFYFVACTWLRKRRSNKRGVVK